MDAGAPGSSPPGRHTLDRVTEALFHSGAYAASRLPLGGSLAQGVSDGLARPWLKYEYGLLPTARVTARK